MPEFREVEYFRALRRGRLYCVSLSETDAWHEITTDDKYAEDPRGWTVERCNGLIPTARGERIEGSGMMVTEEEVNGELQDAPPVLYVASKILWACPWCNEEHFTGLYDDPVNQIGEHSNPSLWSCERGGEERLVLVAW